MHPMSEANRPARPDLRRPHHLIAFGFGSGLAPFAPGTFGTLLAIPIYLLLQSQPLPAYLTILLGLFLIGIPICGRTSDDLGVHDHGGIVWDEVVGYLVTMSLAPPGWLWLVLGFLLFRLFDILKPWPIRWIDRRVSGGFGIMFDDLLAGLFALVVMQAIELTGVIQ
ncbi:phosphatidylglycerophosphatase A [endosymbiont of Riftia pachyptila (vent Ph05)]|nr:phosphatidylglycerophosphatase A [endosymbiont of Riftia pachyptila (vent Ph05)]